MPKQLTVFLENRAGRVEAIAKILGKANVNILSFSLADTEKFGVMRLITDDPDHGELVLRAAGFSCRQTEVTVVMIPQRPGSLYDLLRALSDDINIEYLYPYATHGDQTGIVLKLSDARAGHEILAGKGYQIL